MLPTRGYATHGPKSKLEPFNFTRREPGASDVQLQIDYCGICHSDIHQARGEWGNSMYPMVPGHEVAGRVTGVGPKVTKFKVGDLVGVGCFVDSCRTCSACREGEEQFCETHLAFTYNSTEMDEKTPTYGGYSNQMVVDEKYVLRIPPTLPLDGAAPLLCAGITTYSPLRRFGVKSGDRVGVVGLGGLGHMGVKIAAAMGADVTVFSTSPKKEADARRLGAKNFVVSTNPDAMKAVSNSFNVILDTVSGAHDLNTYLNALRRDGTLVVVGVSVEPAPVATFGLIMGRRRMAGSIIGGIRETQEMLDFCAKHNIPADVEVIPIRDVEKAYDRTVKGDVRYRFVIDMKTL
ncbi:MAG TPA: NAD(P)-dependent alcohol dehydrogenase [Terriglobia bacterium]|nr:NAD(P)-dependent alcohol dehydrogenase [Terriglobia bacterium]